MKTITTAITVLPNGHVSDMATTISVDDEGAGPFVIVQQVGRDGAGAGKVGISTEEWPHICAAIEQIFESCRSLGDAG